MNKRWWYKSKGWLITFSVFILIMMLADSCMQFRMSKPEINKFFTDKKVNGTVHSFYHGERLINYAETGDSSLPLVVFVHGSPGSLSAFINFLTDTVLLKHAQLISVDRPGFGASNFGHAERSLKEQAALLKLILEQHTNQRPIILVGHSLGGPVIARIAMDYPDLVDGLIFVAGSIDPTLEPHEWFRAPLAYPPLRWVIPRSIRASNDEIYKLKPELQQMIPLWSAIKSKAIFIQGKKDDLVDPGNAAFAKKMMTGTSVQLVYKDDMNHFVPWTNPDLIRNAILQMVNADSTQGSLNKR